MRKNKNSKHGWFYNSVEPGDEVGGVIIDAIFKFKTVSGWKLSMLVGEVHKGRENYKKGEKLALVVYYGNTQNMVNYYFKRRKNMKAFIDTLITKYVPAKATRFIS